MLQENIELVRQAFEAFNRDDRAPVTRLPAPDVEWHTLAGPILGVGMQVASVYEIRAGMVAGVRDYGSRDEALEAVGLRD